MHPGGRHDELIGGVAGRKCREAHCLGDDFWSEREDVHVAGDGVVEPCFEIAVEGQLAELRLLASHSLMALSPNVSLASARIRRRRSGMASLTRDGGQSVRRWVVYDTARAAAERARSPPRLAPRPRDPSRRAAVAVLLMHVIENHALQRHLELRQRARQLVHHANVIRIEGDSQRRREAEEADSQCRAPRKG